VGHYPVKTRAVDRNYSRYIRRRGACEICGRTDIKLEAAHYFSRGKEAVRFDERNVHCLCYVCHKTSHEDKNYYKDWMIKKYGQTKFNILEFESNGYCKKDDKLNKIIIKELLDSVGLKWE
jgi:hypothetical protein